MEAFRRVPRMSAADTLKVRDTSPMIFSTGISAGLLRHLKMDMPYSTGSTPSALAVRSMIWQSSGVVVGDFMITVSVSMAPSSTAAMCLGSSTP